MNMNFKTRLFLVLFAAGFPGVLSLLLLDFGAMAALFPSPSGTQLQITPAIKALSLVQPTVLLALAVFVGVLLAAKVRLSAPVAEAVAASGARRGWVEALRPQVGPGVLGSVVGAASILLSAVVFKPFMTAETISRISEITKLLPLPMRFLYGGITEEVLLRWGLMTLLVWVAWRLFQKQRSKPGAMSFILAILVSAFLFGLGHLPVAFVVLGELSAAVILFVIVANSAFGIVAGYLYWKFGLESAMIAHLLGHVILVTASYAGAYF